MTFRSALQRIKGWELFVRIVRFLQGVKLPGFRGLSLWYVMRFFAEGIVKGSINMRSASISFRIFLAFFPGIIMLLTLIPYIPIPHFQQNLFDSIRGFFPGDTFSLFESTLDDLINQKHSALLSIGFILMVYYASSSINAILIGFNSSYHLHSEERGHPFALRIASIILIFILGLIMTIAVVLMMFSTATFSYFHRIGIIGDKGYIPLISMARWIISVFLVYAVYSILYNVGVVKKAKWKFLNTGATFATLFFVVTSIGFAYFINNFAQYNKLYGSLGTLMVLMIWLNFNCMILLLGFELNAAIRKAHKSIPKPKAVLRNRLITGNDSFAETRP
jgi:membrane protein